MGRIKLISHIWSFNPRGDSCAEWERTAVQNWHFPCRCVLNSPFPVVHAVGILPVEGMLIGSPPPIFGSSSGRGHRCNEQILNMLTNMQTDSRREVLTEL